MAFQAANVRPFAVRSERRRSQRVPLHQPLDVAWHLGDGTYISAKAKTEVVSANGARLRVDRELPVRSVVALKHQQRDDWMLARVLSCGSAEGEGWRQAAIELAVANERFWGDIAWTGL